MERRGGEEDSRAFPSSKSVTTPLPFIGNGWMARTRLWTSVICET